MLIIAILRTLFPFESSKTRVIKKLIVFKTIKNYQRVRNGSEISNVVKYGYFSLLLK